MKITFEEEPINEEDIVIKGSKKRKGLTTREYVLEDKMGIVDQETGELHFLTYSELLDEVEDQGGNETIAKKIWENGRPLPSVEQYLKDFLYGT